MSLLTHNIAVKRPQTFSFQEASDNTASYITYKRHLCSSTSVAKAMWEFRVSIMSKCKPLSSLSPVLDWKGQDRGVLGPPQKNSWWAGKKIYFYCITSVYTSMYIYIYIYVVNQHVHFHALKNKSLLRSQHKKIHRRAPTVLPRLIRDYV